MPKGNIETDMAETMSIDSINEDLLHHILERLPAKSFAYASCVNRFWNSVCNRIFSRPKMISAFSRNPNQTRAREEVLDKVLSKPIRPHFVIANITFDDMEETLRMITERVGSSVPIIVSLVAGVLGKEACSDMPGQGKHHVVIDGNNMSVEARFSILLTIGYLPGMKVDVIPVIHAEGECLETTGDKFVMDIENFVSEVSGHAAPACLILFAEDTMFTLTEPIIRKLDYAMPAETIIVGGQSGEFLHKRANESVNVELHRDGTKVLAGLIIARDRHRPIQAGRIQFHTAISRGMSSVDLRYKAANVVSSLPTTLLTAKRSGEAEILSGVRILDDIEENLLEKPLWGSGPYIGVIKQRRCSCSMKMPKIMTSLVFHQVIGADEQYLTVNGGGINTGDCLQVYFPDLKVAELSLKDVSSQLRSLKSKLNKPEVVVGGFVFASARRGDSSFGYPNADSSPLLMNFPELSYGGIFCDGEIGRSLLVEEGEEKKESSTRSFLHFYSSVYLVVTYT